MDWIAAICFFVLGTICGNFINGIIYKLPRGESILSPRSHCPHCKTTIPFYRNIHIISFLLQKGKCASCGKEISIQYPIVEILTGFVWMISFTYFTPLYGTMIALFSSILITLAWIDMQIMMIPLSLIVSGLILIIVGVMVGVLNWQTALWGGLTGVLIPLAMMGLTYLFTKRQGMGWGDVQLGFILGAWLGPLRMILTLFIAASLGLLVWVGVSLFKGFDKNRPLPFAPYLVIGAITMIFLGSYVGIIFDKFLLL